MLNLFCTVVVIQQTYLTNRLATGSSLGFEMAKSMYLNNTFVALRHLATSCFYRSIPVFLASTALMLHGHIWCATQNIFTGLIICGPMLLMTVAMFLVHSKQKRIFVEKL